MSEVIYGTESGVTVVVQALGLPGPAGTPPVITATASTGAPGSSASVAVSGTPTAPILAFTIPRGDTGATGLAGDTGAQGPTQPVVVLNTFAEYPGSPVTGTFYVVKA